MGRSLGKGQRLNDEALQTGDTFMGQYGGLLGHSLSEDSSLPTALGQSVLSSTLPSVSFIC